MGVAVQLDDAVAGQAGRLVESVDILGDDTIEDAAPVQVRQRLVAGVGSRVAHDRPGPAAALPVEPSLGLAGHELPVGEWREAVPDAAGPRLVGRQAGPVGGAGAAAISRDAAVGARPGAGEDHQPAGRADQPRQRRQ